MNQQTQSKGGWVAKFILIGAVLILALLAGVYYLKTRQIEEAAPQPLATETQEQEGQNAPADEEGSIPGDRNESLTEEKKEETPETNDKPDANELVPRETETSESVVEDEPNGNLPETGPSDMGGQFIALAALAVSSAAYVQSRRGL